MKIICGSVAQILKPFMPFSILEYLTVYATVWYKTCWLHVHVKAENVMMDISPSSPLFPSIPQAISPKEQTFQILASNK